MESPQGADAATGATLARGAFFNAVAFVASTLRGIFTLLVARLLGSATLGTFVLAWTITDLVSKFATLGLDITTVAFVARTEAAGDRRGSVRIMNASLGIAMTASVVLASAGFWFVWTVGPRLGQQADLARATAVTLLALPGIVLYRVSNGLSRGMTVMHHDIYSRGLTESLGTAAALLIAMAFGLRRLAPEAAAIGGTLASGCVAFAFARRLYVPAADGAAAAVIDPHLVPSLIRASAPTALYDFLNIGVMQIDLIMLGLYVGHVAGLTLETLGIYAAGVEVALGLRKVSQVFAPIFVPVVARQIAAGDIRQAEASYGYLARWMLAILLPALAVLALSGGAILSIFGDGFRRGAVWMTVAGAACALNAFVGLGESILLVRRPGLNLLNSSIALGAAVVLNLWLIPAFGPLGAAIGMLVPYTIQGALRSVEISIIFQWRWPVRALVKPWIAALAGLPLAVLLRASVPGAAAEVGAALIYIAGYLSAWRMLGLEPSDRAVVAHLW